MKKIRKHLSILILLIPLLLIGGYAYTERWDSGWPGPISDTAYDESTWDGVTDLGASKNAIRDKIETLGTGSVDTSGTPADDDFAKFTDENTVEGRSYAETRADLDLEVGTDFYSKAASDAAHEAELDNEAGLMAALSDVANYLQDAEAFTGGVTVVTRDADATPEVSHKGIFAFTNDGALTITDYVDSDGDHTEFSDGDWFIGKYADADITVDFSENENIEGNAGVDFTASATQPVYILHVYEDARWNAVNFTQGYSDPTTLAISTISGAVTVSVTGLLSGGVVTKVASEAYTIGTTNAAECYGGVIYVTGAAVITYPAVVAGMHFTVITVGDVAVSGKPNASDLQYLDGTALNDADKVTNTSGTGDLIVVTYYDGTGWWTISGSNDGDPWTDTGA